MLKDVPTHCGRCTKRIKEGFEISWGGNSYVCKECKPEVVREYQALAARHRQDALFWDEQADYTAQKELVKNL